MDLVYLWMWTIPCSMTIALQPIRATILHKSLAKRVEMIFEALRIELSYADYLRYRIGSMNDP